MPSPLSASGGAVACTVIDVAHVNEEFGLVVTIPELAAEFEGPFVVGDGLPVVAEPMVNEAETVQRGLYPVVLSELLARGESTLAAAQRLLIVAEQGVRIADVVECQNLHPLVACPVQLEGTQ